MNEENTGIENPDNEEFQVPQPEVAEAEPKEEPQMSEVSTLANIFFEPGRTFEDLRRKPRFILAFVIFALLATAYTFVLSQKIGEERYRRFSMEQAEKNPQFEALSQEQKEQSIEFGLTIQKVVGYALPLFLMIAFLIGSLLYWLGTKAMGGSATFLQTVSVWVYSSFAPGVVSVIANLVVLIFKSPDDIEIATSARGVIQANPTLLIGGNDTPVLTTLLSTIDLFAIWGLILAAIGLTKVARISQGSAWAIVLILTLIGITFRVIGAFMNGIPS
ncbi:MAG: YIP1 family protein [Pyrinomonadaceae bacterium]|nr:YIP1 family protein [Pyrinomonadaceae bacterium]